MCQMLGSREAQTNTGCALEGLSLYWCIKLLRGVHLPGADSPDTLTAHSPVHLTINGELILVCSSFVL